MPKVAEKWWVKVIAAAFAAAVIGGVFAWADGVSEKLSRHDTAIEVSLANAAATKESIEKIERTQNRMEDKLDRVLEERLKERLDQQQYEGPPIYGREYHGLPNREKE